MPVMNIDHLVMANRSQETSIVQSNAESKMPAAQVAANERIRHTTEENTTRTTETQNIVKQDTKFDAREKGKNEYVATEKKKQEPEDEEGEIHNKELLEQILGVEGRSIDLKL
ncbi:MAG: hypothetical protein SPL99_03835 [Catonella sp.]|jgi:hypothetical protein|nr:hypothetical protein [Catonella sp.]MDY6356151.1 hypothetical protein [Catonella sp.]